MPNSIPEILTLPAHPAVPGLILRRFRGAADYPGITDTGNLVREDSGQEWVLTVDDTAREFAHLVNSDPAQDMIVAEIDGEIAGFVRGEWFQEAAGPYRYWFELSLVPNQHGHGIRRAMLHWVEARLRQVAAGQPADAVKTFITYSPPRARSLAALLEDEGYSAVRYYYKMVRPLAEPIVDFPLPAGLELRPVTPEHYRLIWDADEEAFRDHFGHSVQPEERYREWLEDPVIFQPALWQIAWDTESDEIAGQVRTFIDAAENEKYGRRRGYTEFISVRRPYRRRGLARALIAESLRVQVAHGMTESALTVDTENLSGAVRLYTDSGFRPIGHWTAYHKAL